MVGMYLILYFSYLLSVRPRKYIFRLSFFNVYGCFVCMSIMCIQYLLWLEEGIRFPGSGVTVSHHEGVGNGT